MRLARDFNAENAKAAKCREELDALLGSYIDDPKELRDVHRAVDDLLEALNDRDDGGAQDMSPDAIAARICDPARSRLNALARGVRDPSDYVR